MRWRPTSDSYRQHPIAHDGDAGQHDLHRHVLNYTRWHISNDCDANQHVFARRLIDSCYATNYSDRNDRTAYTCDACSAHSRAAPSFVELES